MGSALMEPIFSGGRVEERGRYGEKRLSYGLRKK